MYRFIGVFLLAGCAVAVASAPDAQKKQCTCEFSHKPHAATRSLHERVTALCAVAVSDRREAVTLAMIDSADRLQKEIAAELEEGQERLRLLGRDTRKELKECSDWYDRNVALASRFESVSERRISEAVRSFIECKEMAHDTRVVSTEWDDIRLSLAEFREKMYLIQYRLNQKHEYSEDYNPLHVVMPGHVSQDERTGLCIAYHEQRR